jgi:hypothetical protein
MGNDIHGAANGIELAKVMGYSKKTYSAILSNYF